MKEARGVLTVALEVAARRRQDFKASERTEAQDLLQIRFVQLGYGLEQCSSLCCREEQSRGRSEIPQNGFDDYVGL